MLLGMYRGNGSNGPTGIDVFSTWLGKQIEVGVGFTGDNLPDWTNIEGPDWNLGPWRTWLQAKPGRKLHYRLAMMPNGITLAAVARGDHDSRFVTAANRLAQYGLLAIEIAPGWEMDGGWYAWSAKAGNGQQANYVAAFRRIVQVMRAAQPGNQWKWVWNPTADDWPDRNYLESIWPGDSYVDRVGVDCYDKSWWSINGVSNYYPSTCDAVCRLLRQQAVWERRVAKLSILRDMAKAHGKPMVFPEWGLVTFKNSNAGHDGGDNPYFIQKMYEFFLDPANNVAMQAYFNRDNSGQYHFIGDGSTFPHATAKYKQLFSQ